MWIKCFWVLFVLSYSNFGISCVDFGKSCIERCLRCILLYILPCMSLGSDLDFRSGFGSFWTVAHSRRNALSEDVELEDDEPTIQMLLEQSLSKKVATWESYIHSSFVAKRSKNISSKVREWFIDWTWRLILDIWILDGYRRSQELFHHSFHLC